MQILDAFTIILHSISLPLNLNAVTLFMPAFIATKNLQTTQQKFGKKRNGEIRLCAVAIVNMNSPSMNISTVSISVPIVHLLSIQNAATTIIFILVINFLKFPHKNYTYPCIRCKSNIIKICSFPIKVIIHNQFL